MEIYYQYLHGWPQKYKSSRSGPTEYAAPEPCYFFSPLSFVNIIFTFFILSCLIDYYYFCFYFLSPVICYYHIFFSFSLLYDWLLFFSFFISLLIGSTLSPGKYARRNRFSFLLNQIFIVITLFRLICQQAEFRLVWITIGIKRNIPA